MLNGEYIAGYGSWIANIFGLTSIIYTKKIYNVLLYDKLQRYFDHKYE